MQTTLLTHIPPLLGLQITPRVFAEDGSVVPPDGGEGVPKGMLLRQDANFHLFTRPKLSEDKANGWVGCGGVRV